MGPIWSEFGTWTSQPNGFDGWWTQVQPSAEATVTGSIWQRFRADHASRPNNKLCVANKDQTTERCAMMWHKLWLTWFMISRDMIGKRSKLNDSPNSKVIIHQMLLITHQDQWWWCQDIHLPFRWWCVVLIHPHIHDSMRSLLPVGYHCHLWMCWGVPIIL